MLEERGAERGGRRKRRRRRRWWLWALSLSPWEVGLKWSAQEKKMSGMGGLKGVEYIARGGGGRCFFLIGLSP